MVHGKDPVLDPLHSPSSRIVSGTARSHWKYLIDRTAPRGHARNWRTRTKTEGWSGPSGVRDQNCWSSL